MLERRANPIGRAATIGVPRISLGGLRLAVLDIEQTANFMIDLVFPARRVGRPLYLTSANGEVLARCSTEPMTERLFRAAEIIDTAAGARCNHRPVSCRRSQGRRGRVDVLHVRRR